MRFEFVGDSCNEHEHDFGHAVPVEMGGLHVIESKLADPKDQKSAYVIKEFDVDAPARAFVEAILNGELKPDDPELHTQFLFKSNFIVINADTRHKLIARYDNTIAGCLYPPRKAKIPHDIEGIFTGWTKCCG